MRKPSVACVWATHQSSGTGGTTCRARSFLSSRLPTCGPLPCVITTSWPCATSSAICSHAPSTAMRWDSGSAPRSPAIALPPRATTSRSAMGGSLRDGHRRPSRVPGSSRQPELELAQQVGEPALLGLAERADDAVLVRQVRRHQAVDQLQPDGGESDENPAPVSRVWLAGDEPRLLELVQ